MLHYAASDLVLHSLPMSHKEDAWLKWVKMILSISRLPNARMLKIWLNIKNNSSRKRIKNRECHATDYAFLRLWYKVLSFCQIYFSRKIGVPELDRNVVIARKVIFIPQTQESIGCCMTFPDF